MGRIFGFIALTDAEVLDIIRANPANTIKKGAWLEDAIETTCEVVGSRPLNDEHQPKEERSAQASGGSPHVLDAAAHMGRKETPDATDNPYRPRLGEHSHSSTN